MQQVKAKKHFGQHFLKDEAIASRIVESLTATHRFKKVLEIGPGMGILSQFLFSHSQYETTLIDIDTESINYLHKRFPSHHSHILQGDFLQTDLGSIFHEPFAVIGNFPYNISSQILFKILEYKQQVPQVVGMFQKEVGVRIASPPGNRDYGILSVLMQAFYEVELLFTLDERDFSPPPKVKSAVLRFSRKQNHTLQCNEQKFFAVVKTAFNQRRKTLRNALRPLLPAHLPPEKIPYLDLRAEALSWQQFEELTQLLN